MQIIFDLLTVPGLSAPLQTNLGLPSVIQYRVERSKA